LKALKEILQSVEVKRIVGNNDIYISNLNLDSRQITTNGMFFAIKGTITDGHKFINSAILNGAVVIICEEIPSDLKNDICYIKLENIRRKMAIISSNFYDNPSQKLKLIGVTGTNGKTTIATLLYQLAMKMGIKAGLLSTVENKIVNETIKATHTTPDVININRLLKEMVAAGCEFAFMEVSSHSLDQERVINLDFDGAIFTNITHDHLDYHKTFINYINAKKKFFDNLKPEAFALTNIDDTNGGVMVQNSKSKIKSYSLQQIADFKGRILQNSLQGLQMKINDKEAYFKLTGKFNAYNLLAVYGSMILSGIDEEEVLVKMTELEPVDGRFDIVQNKEKGIFAIIDYAHTPDALENVLKTVNLSKDKDSKLITVFGAGGNRDKTKRPVMGKIASRLSELVIIPSDNPRDEDPDDIIKDISEGIEEQNKEKVLKIKDREQAIKTALILAKSGDVVIIAGKGHETYQEIKGVRNHFSDKEIVNKTWFKK
jgi:UDP-N-acetylmuramoyl-L-alanyl-D-glutamate--2,6-diaminopimelate ligase